MTHFYRLHERDGYVKKTCQLAKEGDPSKICDKWMQAETFITHTSKHFPREVGIFMVCPVCGKGIGHLAYSELIADGRSLPN